MVKSTKFAGVSIEIGGIGDPILESKDSGSLPRDSALKRDPSQNLSFELAPKPSFPMGEWLRVLRNAELKHDLFCQEQLLLDISHTLLHPAAESPGHHPKFPLVWLRLHHRPTSTNNLSRPWQAFTHILWTLQGDCMHSLSRLARGASSLIQAARCASCPHA